MFSDYRDLILPQTLVQRVTKRSSGTRRGCPILAFSWLCQVLASERENNHPKVISYRGDFLPTPTKHKVFDLFSRLL